jgi:non-canonical (house-cleaning) NTP pyrophosphatase
MIIVVGSQSKVKLGAVHGALDDAGIQAVVVGVKASSSVNEQPLNGETLLGARNRAVHAQELHPGADLYLAIESGIFEQDGGYFDKAIVLGLAADGKEHVQYSEAVQFPAEMVEIAKAGI